MAITPQLDVLPPPPVRIAPRPRMTFPGIDQVDGLLLFPSPPSVQLAPARGRQKTVIPQPRQDENIRDLFNEAQRQQVRDRKRQVTTITQIIGQGCIEAEMGLRSLQQLSSWMMPDPLDKVRKRVELVQNAQIKDHFTRNIRASSTRVCEVARGIFESSTNVWDGHRMRAVAMRVELHRSRWKVTTIEIG